MSREKILAEIVVADLTEAGVKPPKAPIPQMSRARHRRLYPHEGYHQTPHPTRTAQTIHQEPRVGEKGRRSHRRWHRDWQDNRHVRGAPGRFPRQRGNHPLLMHLGAVSLCQRHHERNTEHLHGKHEKEVRRAHERQLAGPL